MKHPKPHVTNFVLLEGAFQKKGVQEIKHYCLPTRNPGENPTKILNMQRFKSESKLQLLHLLWVPRVKHCQKGRTMYVNIGYSTVF